MKETGAVLAFLAIGAAVIGVIVFGGWEAGWWFRTQNTNRESQVYQQSYGVQTSVGDALSRQITDISKIDSQIAAADPEQAPMLRAQKQHETDDACAMYSRLTQPNPSFAAWAGTHCAVSN